MFLSFRCDGCTAPVPHHHYDCPHLTPVPDIVVGDTVHHNGRSWSVYRRSTTVLSLRNYDTELDVTFSHPETADVLTTKPQLVTKEQYR